MKIKICNFHASFSYEVNAEFEGYELDEFENFVITLFNASKNLFLTDFKTTFKNKLITFTRIYSDNTEIVFEIY